jgi:hypothetical protein
VIAAGLDSRSKRAVVDILGRLNTRLENGSSSAE